MEVFISQREMSRVVPAILPSPYDKNLKTKNILEKVSARILGCFTLLLKLKSNTKTSF